MAKFEIEVGNNVYEVDAADETSAVAKLKGLGTPAADERSAASKFATGFSTGATKLVKGVGEVLEKVPLTAPAIAGAKALFPEIEETFSPERIAAMEEETKRAGGWGTAGEIGANIVGTAIPANQAYKALVLTKAIAQLGRLAPYAAAAATGGGTEAIITPGDIAERAKAAGYGAAGGVGGELVGKVLTKALTKLVTPSGSAEQLLAEGIVPTVGQGAASPVVRGAENVAAVASGAANVALCRACPG